MNPKLIRSLTTISDSVTVSKSTKSIYFNIGRIVVRVSDHFSINSDYDLAIFINPRGYTVIPMMGNNKEVQYFYNTNDVINFIANFEHFARIFYGDKPKSSDIAFPIYDVVTPEIWNMLNKWNFIEAYKEQIYSLYKNSPKNSHPAITNELRPACSYDTTRKIALINKLIKKFCTGTQN